MLRSSAALSVLSVLAVCSTAQAPLPPESQAAGPPAGAGEPVWFETLMSGMRIGVVREERALRDDGSFRTTVTSELAVERFGERVEMRQEDVWLETEDGRPLEYVSTRELSEGEETTLLARIDGDRLVVESLPQSGGQPGSRGHLTETPVDSTFVFPGSLRSLHRERGLVPGDSYSYSAFDPDLQTVTRCSVSVASRETLAVSGRPVALAHIRLRCDAYGDITIDEWRDLSGALWRQRIESLGVETLRLDGEPEEAELSPPDLAVEMLVESDVLIRRPDLVDEALYEIWLEGGDAADALVSDGRQTIEERTDRGVLLRVERSGATGGGDLAKSAEPDPAVYLQDNALLQCGDSAIEDAAAEAVRGIGDEAASRADAISRAVAAMISDVGYGVAFASASEVLETGRGDCSEHAVLAAAMARSLGIPSRVVAGLVHFERGFAYHMWLEVWTGGGWYAVDPTRGSGGVDATHIALGKSALEAGRVGELSLSVLRAANRLNLRVVEYVEAGETVRP